MKFNSLLARMDRLPPCMCRLFARRQSPRGWVPKSHFDVARDSKIPKSMVALYSRMRSWGNIPIDKADRFARACGVNLAEIDEAITRLRLHRTRLLHLRAGNAHQRRMIADLLEQSKPSTKMKSP